MFVFFDAMRKNNFLLVFFGKIKTFNLKITTLHEELNIFYEMKEVDICIQFSDVGAEEIKVQRPVQRVSAATTVTGRLK